MDKPGRQLRKRLAGAIREQASSGDVAGPPAHLKRPLGWGADLVMAVLADATEPMSPMQVNREIERRFKESIARATVTHVLRRSKLARSGRIVQVAAGLYRRSG